jgi:hypothetical protein
MSRTMQVLGFYCAIFAIAFAPDLLLLIEPFKSVTTIALFTISFSVMTSIFLIVEIFLSIVIWAKGAGQYHHPGAAVVATILMALALSWAAWWCWITPGSVTINYSLNLVPLLITFGLGVIGAFVLICFTRAECAPGVELHRQQFVVTMNQRIK